MVKSILNGGVTYYPSTRSGRRVGAHYEISAGVVSKYYYAGSQRIAMRVSDTLSFIFGDHLGSTSMTTDSNGNITSQMRYKPWGDVRYASGTVPTKYTYTGQRSFTAEIGLIFYNARWYDPALSRFVQADTIVPPRVQDNHAHSLPGGFLLLAEIGHSLSCYT